MTTMNPVVWRKIRKRRNVPYQGFSFWAAAAVTGSNNSGCCSRGFRVGWFYYIVRNTSGMNLFLFFFFLSLLSLSLFYTTWLSAVYPKLSQWMIPLVVLPSRMLICKALLNNSPSLMNTCKRYVIISSRKWTKDLTTRDIHWPWFHLMLKDDLLVCLLVPT